jgi:Mg2+ and Co2+ transporter CorA
MTTENQQPALSPEEVVHSRPYIAILLEGDLDDIVKAVPEVLARLGRNGGKRGRKLNAEIAAWIRQRLAAGEKKGVLAKEFGVSPLTIENIATGRTYAEVPSASQG